MADRPHWNHRGYQRMARVEWQAPNLVVHFEDGTRACLEARRLLGPDDEPVEWHRLTWSPYEIAVPGPYEVVVIPWSRVRVLTDAEYAAHLAAAAADEARLLGARVRQLRKARGLTSKVLAARAGIPPQHLSRIERGEHPGGLAALEPLLATMGCTLHDLIADEPTDQATEARECPARQSGARA
jgi:DNA-binding XRE family transcriptional regulator